MRRQKKAQSQVIATVLLILIVIITIMVIMAFVVPLVKRILSNDCPSLAGKITVQNNPKFTCWNTTGLHLQIHLGAFEEEIKGFIIAVGTSDGSSKTYSIKPGSVTGVRLYDGSTSLSLPKKNGELTYVITDITTKPEYVRIHHLTESCLIDKQPSIPEC